LPGTGHSSPTIVGERLYITSADASAGKRYLLCLNRQTGTTLWQRDVAFAPFRQHADNSYASSTPAADDVGVYVSWLNPDKYLLQAFTPDGKDLWSIDLGPFRSQHMNGGSPIVWGELVIFAVDQDTPGGSFVIAVERKTGQMRWKTPRRSDNASSSTPCLFEPAGAPAQVILSNRTEGLVALDAATGKRLWDVPGAMPLRCVASPLAAGELVMANCGEGVANRVLTAVRPPAQPGDKPEVAYTLKGLAAPYVPTPIAVRNRLFILTDAGVMHCVELASGKTIYSQRIPDVGSAGFYASPVCVDGRLLCITKKGELIVLGTADKLEILGRGPLGEPTFATPTV
ncbi:MAG: PQQ-binding-like beta-propeller repeat protein, partial [Gemmatimonadaceae bacterium]|nr:PQQ-binding-like beta-propeller repeat protein [Gemmatimonadaceae bacterium]